MVELTKIVTGKIDPSTPGKKVSKREWKFLLSARASYCNQQFQHDCRELLLFIDDGRENEFFGYPDEISYWREGLCLEPEAVPFAENYLRTRKARIEAGIDGRDWREIPFGEAVTLGKNKGGQPGNKNAIKNEGYNITFVSNRLKERGTSRAYILARLDRDGHAELAAKVRAGELSANAAAITAGFRKQSTAIERALKLLPKLTPTQLKHLRARIDQILKPRRVA